MKKTFVVYKLIEYSNGNIQLQKIDEFNKKYNAEKEINTLTGSYIILTKYKKL